MLKFRAKILIVDDEQSNTSALSRILEQEAYEVLVSSNGFDALQTYRTQGADIVITDFRMPGMTGIELLKALRKINPQLPIVLLTAFGTVDDAVEAMKLGAVDFLSKPITRASVLRAVQDCIARLKNASPSGDIASEIFVGKSAPMTALKRTIRMIAPTRAAVILQGESGTGKEIVAQAIHRESSLSGALVSLNCAAIPESLLESELFGYERGAFTGAVGSKRGLYETADKGTLFLDEIGDMPLSLQSKFLRVLENGTFFRLGGVESRQADVRVIAATNADMQRLVSTGKFREDLWYRLNVINLNLPPLRERGDDILELAEHNLRRAKQKYGRDALAFSDGAKAAMLKYSWPGNVRELVNMVERAIVLCTADIISEAELRLPSSDSPRESAYAAQYSPEEMRFPVGANLKDIEDHVIRRTLDAFGGDKALAAKVLGINLRTIYRKLQEGDAPEKE